jgi:hypothetical protein
VCIESNPSVDFVKNDTEQRTLGKYLSFLFFLLCSIEVSWVWENNQNDSGLNDEIFMKSFAVLPNGC